MPGRISPGFCISKMSASDPRLNRSTAICGSTIVCRNDSNRFIASSSIAAAFVASVTDWPFTWTVRPSICASKSGTSRAIRSTTLSLRASSSRMLTLLRTASSAHCSLRPRAFAIFVICATASFSDLSRRSPAMSPPELSTGCAAPMFVAGAIAAIVPAIVMNVPAEAARAPDGATKVTTGSGALRNDVVIR